MNNDFISRKALNKTIDGITWYHINQCGELVEGAFDDDDALYKAKDIYNAIDNAETVSPQAFINGIVELVSKNGITTVDELLETLKGGVDNEQQSTFKTERPQKETTECSVGISEMADGLFDKLMNGGIRGDNYESKEDET